MITNVSQSYIRSKMKDSEQINDIRIQSKSIICSSKIELFFFVISEEYEANRIKTEQIAC